MKKKEMLTDKVKSCICEHIFIEQKQRIQTVSPVITSYSFLSQKTV